MPSSSKEDYLKYIYHIQSADKKVNTTHLAGTLNISPASVSEMISKLSKMGWITNTPYKGFQLTKEGEKISLGLIRKHRLLEVFLHQHLNYEWDEVHEEAELLEHVCSDNFINKLEEYLGYPKFDPHGDAIPDKNGKIIESKNFILGDSKAGKDYIITKVDDTSDEILKYLSRIGIRLNTKIHINEKLEFDGSVLISIGNKKQLLSRIMVEHIFVTEAA